MKCCKCTRMKKAERRSSMKIYFHGFGDWGIAPTSEKCILCVQMHCLPISDIYVVKTEFMLDWITKRKIKTNEFH